MPVILLVYLASSHNSTQNGAFSPEQRAQFKQVLKREAHQYGGQVMSVVGSRALLSFSIGNPVSCALALQKALTTDTQAPIQVLHVGDVPGRDVLQDDEVFQTLNQLQEVAWPGQILLSAEAARVCQLPAGVVLRDLGVHLLPDLSEPRRIYQVGLSSISSAEFPPLRSLGQYAHNLPAHTVPFVGREAELESIITFFRKNRGRWLSILGPAGIGKTRLAIQAGARLIQDFRHGVFRISMSHLTSLNTFLIALGDALHFSFYGREELEKQLMTYLQDKELLLILDNCERCFEAQAWLNKLIETAPSLRVIATMRERLYYPYETVLELGGLALPHVESNEAIEKAAATRLFLHCARLNLPYFKPNAEEQAAIVRICATVGGMPLGIELAAAWVGGLSCQDIAEELETNLDFLETSLSSTPGQERSLRGLFNSTWGLLGEDLQKTLVNLTVFRSSFDAEDAAAVVECSTEALQTLADKSMLQRQGEQRFELHRVILQYAQEKAIASSMEKVRRRYVHHYLQKLAHRLSGLRGNQQLTTLQALAMDQPHALLAWQWGLEYGEYELLRQALPTLIQFMDMRGLWQEALQLLEQVRQKMEQENSPSDVTLLFTADVITGVGLFNLRMGRHQQAEQWLRRAMELYEQSHHQEGLATVLYRLGDTLYSVGEYEQAEALYRRSLNLFTQNNDVWGQIALLNNLGNLLLNLGKPEEAKVCYERALHLADSIGEQWLRSTVLSNLGNQLYEEGNFDAAIQVNEEALALKRAFGGRMGIAVGLLNLSACYNALKKYTLAENLLRESISTYREIGDWRGLASAHEVLAETCNAQGRYDEALQALGEALRLHRLMNNRWGLASVLNSVAHSLVLSGTPHLAQDYLREAWRILQVLNAPQLKVSTLVEYAASLSAQGAYAEAYRVLEVAFRYGLSTPNRDYGATLREQVSRYLTDEQRVALREQVAHLSLEEAGKGLLTEEA